MAQSWDNARRHARALESALDTKLATYSRLAGDVSRAGGSSSNADDAAEEGLGGYKLVEEEIEELLVKLEQAIDDLTVLINSPSQPPSASMQHAAQRHRENLEDYRRDFQRICGTLEAAVKRHNLLGSVRKDIKWVRMSSDD
ncbi:protein transport protein gos1 [Cryptotrichosporon argae]